MNWYYVEQGQQAGPVDEAQLDELRRVGRIQPDTLIWREGMANWAPYAQARGGGPVPTAAPSPAFGSAPGEESADAVCTECGKIYPKSNMIRYGTANVCANCKPLFIQKLSEGAPLNVGTLHYAGFWIRFAAKFLDGLILVIPFMIIVVAVILPSMRKSMEGGGGMDILSIRIVQLIFFVIQFAYNIYFIGKYGATPGKMACKLKIVTQYGEPVSYARATGRCFAEILSGMVCYIGYIMAGFDKEKRALHDHICSTRVVYKDG